MIAKSIIIKVGGGIMEIPRKLNQEEVDCVIEPAEKASSSNASIDSSSQDMPPKP